MNYKKLNEWNSGFHDWILKRHPKSNIKQNGFMGGFIFGERGTGKSTYCYKVQSKTYYSLNGYNKKDDEESAYKESLEYFFFDPSKFRRFLINNKLKRIITPCICLDDASMHFGNMLHMTDPKVYSALLGETATIRTAVTGFLINAPKRKHVAKFLRDYDDFKGRALVDGGGSIDDRQTWNRKIRFYRWNYYPDEVRYRIQIPFQDKYSCYIPEPMYSWYVDKKNYYEIKHELDVADRIDKTARIAFIENKHLLHEDFKPYIQKWEKEMVDEKQKTKMEEIHFKIKQENIKNKLEKIKERKNKDENG